ncbi:AntA/AntB antirepressor [Fructobacillus sp. EFB-N1]|uniref:phage antirepressor KilAC domain-containing protein n=1 Tax=Fructobacillus sp. EFB-N1 TaxID=1658766 RepID=UPI00064DB909|nr:phage antirepressor KilAC domain-containing protein [Fructobacillus sp. EFB-N1]KMK52760.1 AntA/AntB antirepressor [Fructobacillus sp. EFB-N1]
MNQIIKIKTNKQGEVSVSARELYQALEVKKSYRFQQWFETNSKQLIENVDFRCVDVTTQQNQYGGIKTINDYQLTVDAAKQIAMMSGTDKGREIRLYFIEVEKQWNSPELMLSRSLQYANSKLIGYESQIAELTPKAEMNDVFIETGAAIGVREAAKEMNVKQNEFIDHLLNNKYLYRSSGSRGKLQPYKKYVPKFFVLKSGSVNGVEFTPQVLITPYGRQFFYKKFYAPDQMEMSV